MRTKICCATAVLAFLCFEMSYGGALKKSFTKEKKVETKLEDGKASESSQEIGENSEASEVKEETETKSSVDTAEKNTSDTNSESQHVAKKKIVGDPVVLRVNGKKEFRRNQILADMKMIPPQMIQGISPDKLFEMLRDQKLKAYLMVEQARKAGMDRTKEFLDKVEHLKEEMLSRTFLMKELAPKAENESALKARYTKYLVEFKKGKEYKIFHIMLSSEDAAKAVLVSLAKGEDFSKLAKEKSEAPSKDKGGEEGYVPIDVMPANIKEKISSLKIGEYTKEYVKTDNGFHIFKITDIRETSPQKYEEAKDMLKQVVMHEEMMKLLDRLEKQVKVERFNEDGTPALPKVTTEAASPNGAK